jgi:hypothetical protein
LGVTGLAVAVCVGGGCASNGDADAPSSDRTTASEPKADAVRVRQTSGGTYYVTYAPVPDPIPLNQVFAMDVRVCRDQAMTTPADDVGIVADAAMPHHHHGMNLVPRSERTGPGAFRVTGMLFHMPGYWEIYVDVKGAGGAGESERARFEVEIK